MTDRKLFEKRDFFWFAGLAALALLIIAAGTVRPRGTEPVMGKISIDGQIVQSVPLSDDCAFALAQNPNIRFAVQGGAIGFTASNCPDQTCVRSGFLSHPGQMAACLPNRVSLTVIGPDSPEDMDAVAQ